MYRNSDKELPEESVITGYHHDTTSSLHVPVPVAPTNTEYRQEYATRGSENPHLDAHNRMFEVDEYAHVRAHELKR